MENTDSLNPEPRILCMYGRGMSFRDFSARLKEMYGMDISHDTRSALAGMIAPHGKDASQGHLSLP